MSKVGEILDEYENGQNPHQSEDYRLKKAEQALINKLIGELPEEMNGVRFAVEGKKDLVLDERVENMILHTYNDLLSDIKSILEKELKK